MFLSCFYVMMKKEVETNTRLKKEIIQDKKWTDMNKQKKKMKLDS